MALTSEDKIRAIKISQAIQKEFDQRNLNGQVRSTDIYDILKYTGLIERDRHSGIKFRQFLKKLMQENALDFIPQCRPVKNTYGREWYFHSTPDKVKKGNLRPVNAIKRRVSLDWEEVKSKIAGFPVRQGLEPQQIAIRKHYARAFDFWTKEEEDLLLKAYEVNPSTFVLSGLFKRQPSAIENRLKQLGK